MKCQRSAVCWKPWLSTEQRQSELRSPAKENPFFFRFRDPLLLNLQSVVRRVPASDFCVDYVANLVRSTRHADGGAPQFVKDWILWGVGPRGGQSLIMAARARAALDGRPEVDVEDVSALAAPVLRHRLVLNYNAESQGQTPETVIAKLLETIRPHSSVTRQTHGRIESTLKA